jgi:hypothetical protein
VNVYVTNDTDRHERGSWRKLVCSWIATECKTFANVTVHS